jgi:hypothetical protein
VIQADLDELKIPEKELEDLSGIALSDGFAAEFYRPAGLRDGKKLFSLLLNELLIFGVTLVVSLPVALLANKHNVGSFSDAEIFVRVLQGSPA